MAETEETPRGLLTVMVEVEPEWEEEFMRWYAGEHTEEFLEIDGFVLARRYRLVEGPGPKYLAMFELRDPSVLRDPRYLKLRDPAQMSETMHRMHTYTRERIRRVYELIGEQRAGETPEPSSDPSPHPSKEA
jgi:hypothetical protein